MGIKLSGTNPYLRDPVQRDRSVLRSVATSSAIEGIRAPFESGKLSSIGKRDSSSGRFTVALKR